MSRNILLIAGREFRQIIAMKSFWLTLLLLPAAIAIGPLFASSLEDDESKRVVVIDRAGGEVVEALDSRFALESDRHELRDISRYVRRHKLEAADPDAPWAQHDRWYSDTDVATYRAEGGMDGALAKIERVRPEGTPELDTHEPAYAILRADETLSALHGDALQARVDALLSAKTEDGKAQADVVLLVGPDYPRDPAIRLWSSEQPDAGFVTTLQDTLTGELRLGLLEARGISRTDAQAITAARPALTVTTPPPGGGAREAVLIRSIIPLAVAYILMLSLMLSGSWMLQGSVEERSNKLLEGLLACVRPEELMYGKLLGALAVGLSMIAVWVVCAAVAVFVAQGAVADIIRPALAPLTSPFTVAALIYFFVLGYIAISIIFVAIGALADSMSEAQGYLMPVMLGILLPITFLIQTLVAGKGGILVQALTWIPLWTPFAVLARLGSGIEYWVVIATGILLAAFVALEVVFLGRLFRASLLATGQKPGLRQLIERFKPAQ
ncbi:ABC transporter permease [Qipengyuania sp. 6B39]|uniref:ABC transporter permease n=1 Tax=Qipengyuania proteolytica TaxID=2867239 RepID=UPI001C8AD219|nr:ABC transporter permease [Qipengyuania proteolytica]MBX7494590.1 ABC transporter permease [Qipengyuania proteolytica]